MMKGYLTVYLSLSLSFLAGFILLLTGLSVRNAGKVRLELAVDTAMNSALGEFHRELLERYGLLYIDASYRGRDPSLSNLENRLQYYVEENTSQILNGKDSPWGKLFPGEIRITAFETAAAGQGASMRNQAICYAEDAGLMCEEAEVFGQAQAAAELEAQDVLGQWSELMGHIAEMELPELINESGIKEKAALSNPADWVFGLTGSDMLYLAQADLSAVSGRTVSTSEVISHRQAVNREAAKRSYKQEDALFFSYLFEKLGCLDKPVEEGVLVCQLEYLAKGLENDLENAEAVAEQLFRWRFADNCMLAKADSGLYGQALEAAEGLLAVQLDERFLEPVTESILYACAFLESVSDLRTIYQGGRIPLRKSSHHMAVSAVLGGGMYQKGESSGYTYRQYLSCILTLMGQEQLNMRTLDIMEMDIRFVSGNRKFAMDWCVERFEAVVSASNHYGDEYLLDRKYGYF